MAAERVWFSQMQVKVRAAAAGLTPPGAAFSAMSRRAICGATRVGSTEMARPRGPIRRPAGGRREPGEPGGARSACWRRGRRQSQVLSPPLRPQVARRLGRMGGASFHQTRAAR